MINDTLTPAISQGARHKILVEAARLFVSRGFDGISMREIGMACGLSKPALYYHFRSKEDLFLAILNDSLDEITAMVKNAQAQTGPAQERIAGFARAIFLELPPERRALIRLANQEMGKLSPDQREPFAARYQVDFIEGITAMVRQGVQSGEFRAMDPLLVTWTFMGILYPFFNPEFTRRSEQVKTMIDTILDIFFKGVARDA
jgi:AcrR family transcriptional regulator